LRQNVINKVQVKKMGNVNPTHPRQSFTENQCSSVLLFNLSLWTQGYLHQTRKKRVLYCKFYLQFIHSAVQKRKIQFCWMTKTLHRKDWLKHFTTRFLRVMHCNFVSSKSISKTQETCFYSFGVKMQDINKARIGFREI
jgi:hypothetical protein